VLDGKGELLFVIHRVEDVTEFARIAAQLESANQELESFSYSVSHDLRAPLRVQELVQANADRKVEVTVAPLPPAMGDRGLLRQVLTNLIGNAFKFTRQRPDARVEIGSRDEGGERVYYVRDNGAGFDIRYANKLFGVFQRLHPAAEFEGTGVGLALVQRIIRRHGGRVWGEARVNEGATFHFTLP